MSDSPEVLQRVREGLSLVAQVARRLSYTLGRTSSADVDDLSSAGRTGLLKAAREFIHAPLGLSFRTFAKRHIEWAMIDAHRARSGLPPRVHDQWSAHRSGAPQSVPQERVHLERHVAGLATARTNGLLKQLGVDTQGDFVAVSSITTAEEATQRRQHLEMLARCVESLPAEEAAIIRRHDLEGVPLDGVARELGLTRAKARGLHEAAHQRLKKRLAREMGQ
jgi:RNA polymerase sigma factor (sigma-70 family)